MGFLILPQCALCCCCCWVPNHLTSYIQESWAWGSIFQYNTLYHIFISLGTKETTTSEELLHESNDLLQETSRFTFILLFCSLSNIKMYMHTLRSTWVIDVVPCLNTRYWILDMAVWIWLRWWGSTTWGELLLYYHYRQSTSNSTSHMLHWVLCFQKGAFQVQ